MTTTITTAESILSAEERRELRRTWGELHAKKALRPQDIVLYALLRGACPKKGFTPITNTVKLANGMSAWQGYRDAVARLDNACLDDRRLYLPMAQLLPSISVDRHTALTRALGALTTQMRKEG